MNKKYFVPGIDDSEFVRSKIPMTKEEVRVLSISKMNLTNTSKVVDIGGGTGSVAIECALIASMGKVFVYEKNPDAIDLIQLNSKKFNTRNLFVIEGIAPASIKLKEKMDAAFIGGSSGNLDAILKKMSALLAPSKRIVINATLIETFWESINGLKRHAFKEIDYCQVLINRSKKLGNGNSLEPINPIFIIWGEK